MLMCVYCCIMNTYISQPAYQIKRIYMKSFQQNF